VKSIEENHEVTALALYVRVFTMFCSVLVWSDLGESKVGMVCLPVLID
jgi:hypothetical protein